jgi:hypothetical protein
MPLSDQTPAISFNPEVALWTYSVEAALAGAANKVMLGVFNPGGSGKIVKLRRAWALVQGATGVTVNIVFELRKTSTLGGGAAVSKVPWDDDDPAANFTALSNPTITDQGLYRSFGVQTNSMSSQPGGQEPWMPVDGGSAVKPITLRPGFGAYLKQITAATPSFTVGFLVTEEDS